MRAYESEIEAEKDVGVGEGSLATKLKRWKEK
jgi:hypothetical protein